MKKISFFMLSTVVTLLVAVLSVSAVSVSTVDCTAAPGGNVSFSVTLSEEIEVGGGSVQVTYDPSVLRLVSGTWNLSGTDLSPFFPNMGVGAFAFSNATQISGDLFTVNFEVLDTAATGESNVVISITLDDNSNQEIFAGDAVGKVVVNCPHANEIPKIEIPSTCKDQGHAAGIYCLDCNTYTAGGDLLPKVDHTYVGENEGWVYAGSKEHERVCTVCGDVEHQPHNYGDWYPNDKTGEHDKVCSGCGNGESGEHVFDAEIATDEYKATTASCTKPATYFYSCSVCGLAGTQTFEYGPMLDHTYDCEVEDAQYKVSDADCLNGTVYYKSCVCGEAGTETFMAGDKLGHNFATAYSYDADLHYYECLRGNCDARDGEEAHHGGTATCTAQAVCDDCGQSYGDMLNHTYDQKVEDAQYKVSDADCLNGTVYYKSCICGLAGTETFMASDKLGHDFATTYSYDADRHYYECLRPNCDARDDEEPHHGGSATCTASAVCDDCGQSYGATLDHTYDQKKVDTAYLVSAADCTNAAVYYKSCVCGLAGTETFTDGTNLGHTGGTASCTEQAICTRCDQPYGALLAHVYDQEKAEDAYLRSEANCTDAAVYYHSCICGKSGKTTFTVGTELGHDFATQYSFNSRYHYYECTRDGCDEVDGREAHVGGQSSCSDRAVCTVCNNAYGGFLDHNYSVWLEYDENDHMHQCLNCDEWDYAPHSWDDGVVTIPATEQTTGAKLLTCYDCGATKTVVIPELSHVHSTEGEWKSNDTQHWHECSCGEHTEVADHTWSETVTTPATCEQKGVKTLSCTVCGTTKTEDIPMTDHTWNEGEVTTEATEESTGVKTYTCTTCGAATKTEEIPVLEHTHKVVEGEWKSDETQHWHECSCGEHSDVANHTWSETVTTLATCENKGVKTLTCTVCGTIATKDIPMIDHTWNEGEVTTEATEESTGIKTYTCTSCGSATKTEEIPQLEPSGTVDEPETPQKKGISMWLFLLIILICLLLILLIFVLFMRRDEDRY